MVTMFSTHCPKCEVLADKLRSANIEFKIVDNVSTMTRLGIDAVPVLSVDGNLMSFKESVDWINKVKGSDV